MMNIFKSKTQAPENMGEVVNYLKKLENDLGVLGREVARLQQKSKSFLQKVSVVRFNPFKEAGGDQSFSIAMLDDANNGFVVTSLYGREGNRVYAKPINGGASKYQLSDEEKEAIEKAMVSGQK